MTYAQRFHIVRQSIIKHCKECVSRNWEEMFDMWLQMEADWEFGDGYKNIFKEQFGEYITEEIEAQLWFAGKNILYSINTLIAIKGDECELEDILDFVERFVSEQLDDFDNDYDTTGWFNNETANDEGTKEDNPQ